MKPYKVLVLDDEEDICEFLEGELKEMGFTACHALTAEAALELIEKEHYDIFLVDFKLSTRLTGLDVIKIIRKNQPDAIVVVMTGYIDIDFKQQAEKLKVNGFLMKPDDVQMDVFPKKIQSILRFH